MRLDITPATAVHLLRPPLTPSSTASKRSEKMQSTTTELALVFRRLADLIEEEKSSITVTLADETIVVPSDADVKCKYESSVGLRELNIRVAWRAGSSEVQLIRQHSETVQDSLGNLYDVYIYGEPRFDGSWQGWIEFVPLKSSLPSRRTGRETSQPDVHALQYWATGLERLYLAGAFERAT